MRDLEWLKSEVDELHIEDNMDLEYVSGYIDAKINILELIEEVEHKEYVSAFNDGYEKGYERGTIEVHNKPQIPEHIAEWVEKNKKENNNIRDAIINIPSKGNSWLFEGNNFETFARAWLDGYTVEEDKYFVKNKHQKTLLLKVQDSVRIYDEDTYYHNIEHTYELTEKEIKDYDENYWVFAKPVK